MSLLHSSPMYDTAVEPLKLPSSGRALRESMATFAVVRKVRASHYGRGLGEMGATPAVHVEHVSTRRSRPAALTRDFRRGVCSTSQC